MKKLPTCCASVVIIAYSVQYIVFKELYTMNHHTAAP